MKTRMKIIYLEKEIQKQEQENRVFDWTESLPKIRKAVKMERKKQHKTKIVTVSKMAGKKTAKNCYCFGNGEKKMVTL